MVQLLSVTCSNYLFMKIYEVTEIPALHMKHVVNMISSKINVFIWHQVRAEKRPFLRPPSLPPHVQ